MLFLKKQKGQQRLILLSTDVEITTDDGDYELVDQSEGIDKMKMLRQHGYLTL